MSKNYDWEAIEADYRAGALSIAVIAKKHGMPKSTLATRAKREGWQRDLSHQVRKAVAAKIAFNSAQLESGRSDTEIIEEAATQGASLVIQHQYKIQHWQRISDALAATLEQQLAKGKVEVVGKDGSIQLADLPLDYVSKTLAQGVAALEKLINLERQAHNLDETERTGRTLDELLEDLAED